MLLYRSVLYHSVKNQLGAWPGSQPGSQGATAKQAHKQAVQVTHLESSNSSRLSANMGSLR